MHNWLRSLSVLIDKHKLYYVNYHPFLSGDIFNGDIFLYEKVKNKYRSYINHRGLRFKINNHLKKIMGDKKTHITYMF